MLAALSCLMMGAGPVVCLDPGHTSEVGAGTRGARLTELQVVWDLALATRDALSRKGVRVVLTKSRVDETVTNRRRAEIANRAKADLMVRLHADAAPDRGFAVFAPDRPGTARDGTRGPAKSVISASRRAGLAFHGAMAETLRGHLPDRGYRTERQTSIGARQGALTGSIFSEVPVVLVEVVVLTQPKDEAFLESKEGWRRMTTALTEGTMAALGELKRSR